MGRNGVERNFREITKVVATLLFMLSSTASLAAPELVDKLLAEVNGEAILLSDIEKKVEKGPLVVVSAYPLEEGADEFDLALQDEVNLRLMLQRAEELGISIEESRLDQEIQRFLDGRNIEETQLSSILAQQGLSMEQYRQDFRQQMLLNQFQGREIYPMIQINDRDLELLYISQVGSTSKNVKVQLRQILIKVSSQDAEAIREQKLELVAKLADELDAGLDFEQAVNLYSEHESSKAAGGLLPALNLNEMAPVFQQPLAELNEGQVSQAIETPFGYYFFKLESRELTKSEEFQKLKPQLEARLRQQEVMRHTVNWIEDQRRRSDIRMLQ